MFEKIAAAHKIFFTLEVSTIDPKVPKDAFKAELKDQLQFIQEQFPTLTIIKNPLIKDYYHIVDKELLRDKTYPLNQRFVILKANLYTPQIMRVVMSHTGWRIMFNFNDPTTQYQTIGTKVEIGTFALRDILCYMDIMPSNLAWCVVTNPDGKILVINVAPKPIEFKLVDPNLPLLPVTNFPNKVNSDLSEDLKSITPEK